MKKLLLLTCFVVITGQFFGQLVQNGNFTTWQSDSLFEYPEDWFLFNEGDYTNQFVERAYDAYDGTYSIKLNTLFYEGDTEAAMIMYGIPGEGSAWGLPFDKTGDSLHFWYKGHFVSGDQGMAMLILFKDGAEIQNEMIPITSSTNNWTKISWPVNPSLIQPDSMFLAFISSSPDFLGGNPQVGSWLMIDKVYFTLGSDTTKLTVPNFSFENWKHAITENPAGWSSSNNESFLIMNNIENVEKSTDYYTPPYAARLEVLDFAGHPIKPRLKYNNSFSGQPDKLFFAYKYQPAANDNGYLSIEFLRNGMQVGGAFYIFTNTGNNYCYVRHNMT